MKPDLDPTSQEISQIGIELIELTGGTQSRVELNEATVDEYAEAMKRGDNFPPIDVYHDGSTFWLADGFHRVYAVQRAGLPPIAAVVHQGTRRDAVLHSVGANSSHGLRRTNADKRRAVETLLQDEEWSKWSDREIARRCSVSNDFVSRLRKNFSLSSDDSENRTYTTKHGTTATMRVKNIGNIPPGTRSATSVNAEVAAQGRALGLPTRGDSVLPESDLIDKLTHTSPTDVDDRFGALPNGAFTASVESMLPEVLAEEQPNSQHWLEEFVLEDGRKLFISHKPGSKPLFNRTNEMVDWAYWTWNPITGCFHNCGYCYARDIANRFFDTKFEPTFHPDRLTAPSNTKVPAESATDTRAKNVFVCSMADLFGKWIPQEWIMQVFDQVIANPQWNFLFLTKFPQRLQEICDDLGGFPDNAWVGTTVDQQHRVRIAENAFKNIKAKVKWLSCEPMLEHLTFNSLDMFDWVIIGGQSKSTQTPEFQPDWEWVVHLSQQARAANCEIYWKENLRIHPKGVPWRPTEPSALSTNTAASDHGSAFGSAKNAEEFSPAIAPPESEQPAPAPAAPAEVEAPAEAKFKVGDAVAHSDPYIVAYAFHGIVEEITGDEVLVRWAERKGKANECERYDASELRRLE